MDEKQTEYIIDWYKNLENRLLEVIQYIPFDSKTENVCLPALSGIIIESASLIDTVLREEYLPSTKRNDLTIENYAPFYEPKYKLSDYKSIIYIYPPQYILPFNSWYDYANQKYIPLKWWKNYNKLKHNRIENVALSTLQTAIYSLCGFFQIIAKIPTFLNSLIRNEMTSFGNQFIQNVKKELNEKNCKITILIESKLFASPIGKNSFPININDIQVSEFGNSKKLMRFLGKD